MIRLPVSIGEGLDKLTILDIKVQKIQDAEKKAHCQYEYDLLWNELKEYVSSCEFYYNRLRDINLQIWEMQDDIRSRPDPRKCVDILDKNDMRFRIKNILNQTAGSAIQEQKGYPTRRALFIGHMGLGDHIGLIGAVRYVATQYDETVVVCKSRNAENVASFFADNSTIKLWIVNNPYVRDPGDTWAGEAVLFDPTMYAAVYRSGFYAHPREGFDDLPKNFYRDMKIDPSIRHTYFHVPITPGARELFEHVRDVPYIFVQQTSSSHSTELVTWDINTILTIDPNTNLYPEHHEWYVLAQRFVNQKFIDYTLVLQNAKEVHSVDSSFYCLACYLPLKAEIKRCYSRETGAFIATYDFT
jgi:hypothetical protein